MSPMENSILINTIMTSYTSQPASYQTFPTQDRRNSILLPSTSRGRLTTLPFSSTVEDTTFIPTARTIDVEAYLQHLSDRMTISLLPTILFTCIIMVMGIIGNTMVVYVYYTKYSPSSYRTAILALALYDLGVCWFSMPGEVIIYRYYFNIPDGAVCKLVRYVSSVSVFASMFTLVVVARDRYRRICHPFSRQMTAGEATRRALLCLLVAAVLAIPAAFHYGISKYHTDIDGVYATTCGDDDYYLQFNVPFVNTIVYAVMFITVITAIIGHYIPVGRVILRQSKYRKSLKKRLKSGCEDSDRSTSENAKNKSRLEDDGRRSFTDDTKETSSTEMSGSSTGCPMDKNGSFRADSTKDQDVAGKDEVRSPTIKTETFVCQRNQTTSASTKGDKATFQATRVLVIITIVFILSFLPFVFVKVAFLMNKDFFGDPFSGLFVMERTLARSFFINSASNCFVYGFCSPTFRGECKQALKKLFCCDKKIF